MPGPVVGQGQITITANTAPAVAAMQQVQAASHSAAGSIVDRFGAASKAINQSGLVSNLETVSALFIQVGGSVSRSASIITSLIRPVAVLGSAFGELLAPVAALALPSAGFAALAIGLNKIASSGVEAAKELNKLGIEVDPSHQAAINAYSDANEQLTRAYDELAVSVAADVAPALADLTHRLAATIDKITKMREEVGGLRSETSEWSDKALSGLTFGISDRFRELIEGSDELAISTGKLTIMEVAAAEAHQAAAEAEADEAEGARQNKIAKEQATEAARQHAIALRQQAAEQQRAQKLWNDELKRHTDLIVRDYQISMRWFDMEVKMANDVKDATKAANDALRDIAIDQAATLKRVETEMAASTIASFDSITQTAISSYEARRAAGEKFTQSEAMTANIVGAAHEALALTSAAIESVQAANVAMVQLMLAGTPFPAAAAAGVAFGGAMFAASAAAIHAGRPMEFEWSGHGGYGEDPNYNADDVYSHGAGDAPDDPRADKPRDLPGTSRSRRGNRRGQRVEVILVEDRTRSGKLRR